MATNKPSLQEFLDEMKIQGTSLKAAEKLGVIASTYRNRFHRLPKDDPLKKEYLRFTTSKKSSTPNIRRSRQPKTKSYQNPRRLHI